MGPECFHFNSESLNGAESKALLYPGQKYKHGSTMNVFAQSLNSRFDFLTLDFPNSSGFLSIGSVSWPGSLGLTLFFLFDS